MGFNLLAAVTFIRKKKDDGSMYNVDPKRTYFPQKVLCTTDFSFSSSDLHLIIRMWAWRDLKIEV